MSEAKAHKVIERVYLIRHGETQENKEGIVQGQRDTRLNATGLWQSQRVAEALKDVDFSAAYTSDLTRAVTTAEAIMQYHPDLRLIKQQELRERRLGALEGHKSGYGPTNSTPDPGLEPGDVFSKRALGWWTKTILYGPASAGDVPRNVLAVSHGGFIVHLMRDLISMRKAKPAKGVTIWRCYNASVTVVDIYEDRRAEIMMYGDITHLADGDGVVGSNADTDTGT